MRLAKWLGCAAWAGSWYLMYLEVTRWRHVKPSLAFNSDPIPGTDIRPKPGLPLILVYITCAAAPLTVLAALVRERRTGGLPALPGFSRRCYSQPLPFGKVKSISPNGRVVPLVPQRRAKGMTFPAERSTECWA
jgi:hypothetical protein